MTAYRCVFQKEHLLKTPQQFLLSRDAPNVKFWADTAGKLDCFSNILYLVDAELMQHFGQWHNVNAFLFADSPSSGTNVQSRNHPY